MAHMVKDERKVWTMYEKGKAGVVTTNERKMKYVSSVLSFFNNGGVHFIENTVCANQYVDANDRLSLVKKNLKTTIAISKM